MAFLGLTLASNLKKAELEIASLKSESSIAFKQLEENGRKLLKMGSDLKEMRDEANNSLKEIRSLTDKLEYQKKKNESERKSFAEKENQYKEELGSKDNIILELGKDLKQQKTLLKESENKKKILQDNIVITQNKNKELEKQVASAYTRLNSVTEVIKFLFAKCSDRESVRQELADRFQINMLYNPEEEEELRREEMGDLVPSSQDNPAEGLPEDPDDDWEEEGELDPHDDEYYFDNIVPLKKKEAEPEAESFRNEEAPAGTNEENDAVPVDEAPVEEEKCPKCGKPCNNSECENNPVNKKKKKKKNRPKPDFQQ